jgi:hypothetical protein
MADEPEQDLTSYPARRRRVLAGVLAAAALAVPATAVALDDGPSSTSQPATGDTPALTVQDESGSQSQDRDRDGRDCPEKDGDGSGSGSGSGSGDGSDSGGSTSTAPTAL